MASPNLSLAERRSRVGSLAQHVSPLTNAGEQLIDVPDAFKALFPRAGLQRGTVVSVSGSGAALSLAVALCAQASQSGSWLGVVGTKRLGLAAVNEFGVDLNRLVIVSDPPRQHWGSVMAALVDAFDLVLVVTKERVDPGQARRLSAKAKERGSVILQIGRWGWPDAPDVRLDVIESRWVGLGVGHGALSARQVTVTAVNRRDSLPRRKSALWLPNADGQVLSATPALASEDKQQIVATAG